jgi:hypothetical protein
VFHLQKQFLFLLHKLCLNLNVGKGEGKRQGRKERNKKIERQKQDCRKWMGIKIDHLSSTGTNPPQISHETTKVKVIGENFMLSSF